MEASDQIDENEEERDSSQEAAADLTRLVQNFNALAVLGSNRATPYTRDQLWMRLLNQVYESANLDHIRADCYISLSILEFSFYDELLLNFYEDGFLEIKNAEERRVPRNRVLEERDLSITLSKSGEDLRRSVQAFKDVGKQTGLVVPVGFVDIKRESDEGSVIASCFPAWLALVSSLQDDPDLIHRLHWRTLEELVAAAYDREGWSVVLTPRSGDKGRDIIASRSDLGTVRIFDQVKAFSPERLVSANDVRALNGVLRGSVSKGVVTTTSDFAPGVREEFKDLMPARLELRNGLDLVEWIRTLALKNP